MELSTIPRLLGISVALALLAGAMNAAPPYAPSTESLRMHKAPQWFEDAKFGVFIHWGPYAVPAYHEWYVAFMSPKS
ncbi:MAG TPA: alpha-L-fucosidase, partial [Bryobacteraceae bacterium]|nr:alpha-L-fucosidase [Bryobacteraceae bacterium]